MRKYSVLLSAFVLFTLGMIISSCKDDDPPAKPQLSFELSELTVNEADGEIEVKVVLDKPASEDITIDFSLAGTAVDDVSAGTTRPADYEIVGDPGELEIAEGETTGIITVSLYTDTDFESDPEIIEISIDEVDSEDIEITRNDEITITVEQEDGLLIVLT